MLWAWPPRGFLRTTTQGLGGCIHDNKQLSLAGLNSLKHLGTSYKDDIHTMFLRVFARSLNSIFVLLTFKSERRTFVIRCRVNKVVLNRTDTQTLVANER